MAGVVDVRRIAAPENGSSHGNAQDEKCEFTERSLPFKVTGRVFNHFSENPKQFAVNCGLPGNQKHCSSDSDRGRLRRNNSQVARRVFNSNNNESEKLRSRSAQNHKCECEKRTDATTA